MNSILYCCVRDPLLSADPGLNFCRCAELGTVSEMTIKITKSSVRDCVERKVLADDQSCYSLKDFQYHDSICA